MLLLVFLATDVGLTLGGSSFPPWFLQDSSPCLPVVALFRLCMASFISVDLIFNLFSGQFSFNFVHLDSPFLSQYKLQTFNSRGQFRGSNFNNYTCEVYTKILYILNYLGYSSTYLRMPSANQ